MWKPVLFFSVWLNLTVPLQLTAVFTIFQPLLAVDKNGIIMLGLLLLSTIPNVYVATRIWNRIEEKMYKRKTFM
ncbi:hypothetical protein A0126_16650 (plasmid) [Exiguobacterium sp. N4-1P]|uniref:hypothetical protein n=1 Tax=Exiguobacterium sp. N4-1P TaxID=2051906 RepID=UPI000B58807F|nr:hypothetical protein [Exiguobacterium sp. N4-1P]ASI35207.1 hypothetical protein A0126_06375 [Exiguobacterium sp. N4-1P]ASI37220.1 hypothetical protein A0126_16650 [Exiguobacterium sp. N4-1P]